MAWRASRGELGTQASTASGPEPTPAEVSSRPEQSVPESHGPATSSKQPEVLRDSTTDHAKPVAEAGTVDRDDFTERMRAAFARFMASGDMQPNEAAIAALKSVRVEMQL